jgi:predicted transcriptional regulator
MTNLIVDFAAQIVSAHVSNNDVSADQLPSLIRSVHHALTTINQTVSEPRKAERAVSGLQSVFPDHIVCLDCGMGFRMLKRHIRTDHGMTPRQYRTKWGLPFSYPMSAPEYAAARSQSARDSGFGRKTPVWPVQRKRGRPAKGK